MEADGEGSDDGTGSDDDLDEFDTLEGASQCAQLVEATQVCIMQHLKCRVSVLYHLLVLTNTHVCMNVPMPVMRKAAVEASISKFLERTVPLSEIDAHRLVLIIEKVSEVHICLDAACSL